MEKENVIIFDANLTIGSFNYQMLIKFKSKVLDNIKSTRPLQNLI